MDGNDCRFEKPHNQWKLREISINKKGSWGAYVGGISNNLIAMVK